jgi:uncharacterized membrane protein
MTFGVLFFFFFFFYFIFYGVGSREKNLDTFELYLIEVCLVFLLVVWVACSFGFVNCSIFVRVVLFNFNFFSFFFCIVLHFFVLEDLSREIIQGCEMSHDSSLHTP